MLRQADAVIRHPVLRKIVGPDPLAAVTRADLAAALGRILGLLFVLPELKQARPQHRQRAGLVLLLGSSIGTKHDHTRRLVDHADR